MIAMLSARLTEIPHTRNCIFTLNTNIHIVHTIYTHTACYIYTDCTICIMFSFTGNIIRESVALDHAAKC